MRKVTKSNKKTISMALAAVLAFSPVTAMAQTATENNNSDVIAQWQESGRLTGYADGSLNLEGGVTRAEFLRFINTSMGFTKAGEVNFSDVSKDDWFYNDVAIAVNQGYCNGFPDGTFRADNMVTKTEAAVFLVNAKGLTPDESGVEVFTDAENIPQWAKGFVGAAAKAGYMKANANGSFGGEKQFTRGESVEAIDKAVKDTTTVSKDDFVVTPENIDELKDMVIEGNLIISEEFANSEISIENVEIKGDLIVKGGNKVTVNVPLNNIVVEGKARLIVNKNVSNITVSENAAESIISISNGVKVETIKANAKTKLEGRGTIGNLEANADGITKETGLSINKTTTAEGVKSPEMVSSNDSGKGSGSSSSSSSSNTEKVDVESVEMEENTAVIGTAEGYNKIQLKASVTPSNATNKKILWESNDPSKLVVDENGVVTVAADASLSGDETVTITAKSADDELKTATCTVTVKTSDPVTVTPAEPAKDGGEELPESIVVAPAVTLSSGTQGTGEEGEAISPLPTEKLNINVNLVDASTNATAEEVGYMTVKAEYTTGASALQRSATPIGETKTIQLRAGDKLADKLNNIKFQLESVPEGDSITVNVKYSYAKGYIAGEVSTTEVSAETVTAGENVTVTLKGTNLNETMEVALNDSTQDSYEGEGTAVKPSSDAKSAQATLTTDSSIEKKTTYKVWYRTSSDGVWTDSGKTVAVDIDRTELKNKIDEANKAKEGVVESEDGSEVVTGTFWVTSSDMSTFTSAISTAEGVRDGEDTTKTSLTEAVSTLDEAINTFNAAKKDGLHAEVVAPTVELSKELAENREAGVTFTVTKSDDVKYYYTLDGSEPETTVQNQTKEYTDTVTLTAPENDAEETITIKVIAVQDNIKSEVTEKTVTYKAKEITEVAVDEDTVVTGGKVKVTITGNDIKDGLKVALSESAAPEDGELAVIEEGKTTASAEITTGSVDKKTTYKVWYKTSTGEWTDSGKTVKVDIDRTALTEKVAEAEAAKADIQTSTDGNDVDVTAQWVETSVMETFTQAISTANETLSGEETTTSQLTEAVSTLDQAITTFNEAKQQGNKVEAPEVTLSKASATNREEGVTFTVTTKEGFSYFYTLDGTEPQTSAGESTEEYTDTVTLTAPDDEGEQTITIKVIAVKDGKQSTVTEKTVTYAGAVLAVSHSSSSSSYVSEVSEDVTDFVEVDTDFSVNHETTESMISTLEL